jgi:hypothetical protein
MFYEKLYILKLKKNLLLNKRSEIFSNCRKHARASKQNQTVKFSQQNHRLDKTYRDVTDRCKHCGRLRYHVPTFFQATRRKMINCACSASLKWVVIRSSSNQMHASSNLPSMRTKKVGTLVTSLYVSTLWQNFSCQKIVCKLRHETLSNNICFALYFINN